jgi:oligosaccharide repeat unit polymerase
MSDQHLESLPIGLNKKHVRVPIHRDRVISSGGERLWLCALGCAATIYAGFHFLDGDRVDHDWSVHVGLACVILIISYLLSVYIHFKNLFLFGSVYLFAFCIFNLGHIIGDAIGWIDITYYRSGDMAYWCQQAGWQITMALGAFVLGTGLGFHSVPAERHTSEKSMARHARSTSFLFWNGVGLFLGSAFAIIYLYAVVGNIFAYSRVQLYAGIGDTRGLGFALLVLPTAILMLVCGAKSRSQRMFAYLSAATAFLTVMFLGERSAALFPAFVGAALWVNLGRRIPALVVIASAAVLLMVIPAVSHLRALGPYSKINTDDVVRSVEKISALDAIVELGGTVVLVANVARWVPKEEPYLYGLTYAKALTQAIPNISTSISTSPREVVKHGSWSAAERARILAPADWYIFRTNRYMFDSGGGSGFSTVAEAYMNFGIFGIFFVFLLIGFILSRLDHLQLHNYPILLTMVAVSMWPLLKTVRNDFGNFVKPVSLILCTLMIWQIGMFFFKRLR